LEFSGCVELGITKPGLLNMMTPNDGPEAGRSDVDDPTRGDASASNSGRKIWQTALLLAASAAFGGLAVAFWNRKTLTDIRNRTPDPPRRSVGREDDIY
jgi:hypothetical protein